jgi:prepilin-type N-terminal cleavage/methylation domain-containing protein
MCVISKQKEQNGRARCVHSVKFRPGFSIIELLAAIAVLALISYVSFTPRTKSDEQKAIDEANNLAVWLEQAFIKSNVTKQRFKIVGMNSSSANFYVNWITASSTQNEIYASDGQALFSVPSGGVLEYNPIVGFLEGQLGTTIRVYRGSDIARSKVIRYVIISRFGRVRVSKFPP